MAKKSSRNYPIEVKLSSKQVLLFVVMGQTPFYLTSNELKHHFSNIVRTRMCSSIGDQTQRPIFGFERTNIEHRT